MNWLRWILEQPLLVQYALLVLPLTIAGAAGWALVSPRARLLRRAERAARRAVEEARSAGLPIRDYGIWGAVEISPGSLAIVYYVIDDQTLAAAEASGAASRLCDLTRSYLQQFGYPAEPNAVSVVSEEAIARAGGWREYF